MVADCLALAIELADSVQELSGFWHEAQPALRLLAPAELAAVVAAKNRRKEELQAAPVRS